jgi:predicted small lipoprotein YifL
MKDFCTTARLFSMTRTLLRATALLAPLLTGCGQKGPLYLEPEPVATGAAQPEPAKKPAAPPAADSKPH